MTDYENIHVTKVVGQKELEDRLLKVIELYGGQKLPSEIVDKAGIDQNIGMPIIGDLLEKHKIKFINNGHRLMLMPNGGKIDSEVEEDGST